MFRGNLQHAGVKNVEEDRTVKLDKKESLKQGIIIATKGKNNKVDSKVFDLLCDFNGLNKFARFAYHHHSAGTRSNSAYQSSWFSPMQLICL
jgi:hypothetical protein